MRDVRPRQSEGGDTGGPWWARFFAQAIFLPSPKKQKNARENENKRQTRHGRIRRWALLCTAPARHTFVEPPQWRGPLAIAVHHVTFCGGRAPSARGTMGCSLQCAARTTLNAPLWCQPPNAMTKSHHTPRFAKSPPPCKHKSDPRPQHLGARHSSVASCMLRARVVALPCPP